VDELGPFCRLQEVAAILAVSCMDIKNLIESGELMAIDLPGGLAAANITSAFPKQRSFTLSSAGNTKSHENAR